MTNDKDIATRVADKKEEIEKYKEILHRYLTGPGRSTRWYHTGKAHLEELETELAELQKELDKPS